MQETKRNNPIDPNMEKVLVPQRSGDDHEISDPNTPVGTKLDEDKKRAEAGKGKPANS